MSTADELDVLLYAWLSEREARRAEAQFTRYFKAAFPAICRFIRSLNADEATAQDVAQQALIKLFNHLGIERRASDERVRRAVSNLRPLDFGTLHERRVETWRSQVGQARDAAIGFGVARGGQGALPEWKHVRDEINGRMPPLVRQGAHFVGEVRGWVGRQWMQLQASDKASPAHSDVDPDLSGGQSAESEPLDPALQRFLEDVLRYAEGRAPAELDAALGCAGTVSFLTHTNSICASLPALAIPSNGLLYTIAKRQLLDRLKVRHRESAEYVEQLADRDARRVLEELEFEGGEAPETAAYEAHAGASYEQPSGEDAQETEVDTRYAAFLEFLRAPLTRAEAALAATTQSKAKVEQARVDSLRAKYERMLAILLALRESPQPTEEEIARREGLTRNQVKYVIQRIREEFTYFFADLARASQGRRKHQGAGM